MKLTFWGAAQTVTGSMHELKVQGRRYLLDCGMYQGRRKEARERNATFPFPGREIDAVLLSHAHIDHSGNLPTLVKSGFSGPIYTTPATVDLLSYMLPDSAHIQEKDALFMAKRNARRQRLGEGEVPEIVEPLYSMADAEKVAPLFTAVPLDTPKEIGPGLNYRTYEAGHMLGSTAMVLALEENGHRRTLAFSGDVGRRNLPIIKDPAAMPAADYLIMESTYGDRLHKDLGSVEDKLADAVVRTARRGGKIIVPAFAVGRTQQIVLLFHELLRKGKIPSLKVFVDSPLAVNVTKVFQEHVEAYDAETRVLTDDGDDPFEFPQLQYISDVGESKALNELRGPYVVISASGMCEFGRVLHHLRNSIEDPRNTILITGFQAEHTLGRKIIDGWPEVPIFGETLRLRAEVVKLNELSGHADQRELVEWMRPMVPQLKRVFLVHGEPGPQATLAHVIETDYKIPVTIAKRGETFDLA